jgi:hypothetical protein
LIANSPLTAYSTSRIDLWIVSNVNVRPGLVLFDPGRFERGCLGVGGGVSMAVVVVLVDNDRYDVEVVAVVVVDDEGSRMFRVR